MADRRLARARAGGFPTQSVASHTGSARLPRQEAPSVGGQLRELRKNAGLSQRALAQRVGTTASVICRLEHDSYGGHTLDMLRRIGSVLGKRVEVRFLPAVAENQVAALGVLSLPTAETADQTETDPRTASRNP